MRALADATMRFDQASTNMKAVMESFQEEYRLFMHIFSCQSQGVSCWIAYRVVCAHATAHRHNI